MKLRSENANEQAFMEPAFAVIFEGWPLRDEAKIGFMSGLLDICRNSTGGAVVPEVIQVVLIAFYLRSAGFPDVFLQAFLAGIFVDHA